MVTCCRVPSGVLLIVHNTYTSQIHLTKAGDTDVTAGRNNISWLHVGLYGCTGSVDPIIY